MPHIVKRRVQMMAFVIMAIALTALPGCLGGGASVDNARAAEFQVAAEAWTVGIEALTLELRKIQDEDSAFRTLAAVRAQVRELQAAIEPLGELDDNDASYIESKYGKQLRELWPPFGGEVQRVTITGGIPTEIAELLREIPTFGPR